MTDVSFWIVGNAPNQTVIMPSGEAGRFEIVGHLVDGVMTLQEPPLEISNIAVAEIAAGTVGQIYNLTVPEGVDRVAVVGQAAVEITGNSYSSGEAGASFTFEGQTIGIGAEYTPVYLRTEAERAEVGGVPFAYNSNRSIAERPVEHAAPTVTLAEGVYTVTLEGVSVALRPEQVNQFFAERASAVFENNNLANWLNDGDYTDNDVRYLVGRIATVEDPDERRELIANAMVLVQMHHPEYAPFFNAMADDLVTNREVFLQQGVEGSSLDKVLYQVSLFDNRNDQVDYRNLITEIANTGDPVLRAALAEGFLGAMSEYEALVSPSESEQSYHGDEFALLTPYFSAVLAGDNYRILSPNTTYGEDFLTAVQDEIGEWGATFPGAAPYFAGLYERADEAERPVYARNIVVLATSVEPVTRENLLLAAPYVRAQSGLDPDGMDVFVDAVFAYDVSGAGIAEVYGSLPEAARGDFWREMRERLESGQISVAQLSGIVANMDGTDPYVSQAAALVLESGQPLTGQEIVNVAGCVNAEQLPQLVTAYAEAVARGEQADFDAIYAAIPNGLKEEFLAAVANEPALAETRGALTADMWLQSEITDATVENLFALTGEGSTVTVTLNIPGEGVETFQAAREGVTWTEGAMSPPEMMATVFPTLMSLQGTTYLDVGIGAQAQNFASNNEANFTDFAALLQAVAGIEDPATRARALAELTVLASQKGEPYAGLIAEIAPDMMAHPERYRDQGFMEGLAAGIQRWEGLDTEGRATFSLWDCWVEAVPDALAGQRDGYAAIIYGLSPDAADGAGVGPVLLYSYEGAISNLEAYKDDNDAPVLAVEGFLDAIETYRQSGAGDSAAGVAYNHAMYDLMAYIETVTDPVQRQQLLDYVYSTGQGVWADEGRQHHHQQMTLMFGQFLAEGGDYATIERWRGVMVDGAAVGMASGFDIMRMTLLAGASIQDRGGYDTADSYFETAVWAFAPTNSWHSMSAEEAQQAAQVLTMMYVMDRVVEQPYADQFDAIQNDFTEVFASGAWSAISRAYAGTPPVTEVPRAELVADLNDYLATIPLSDTEERARVEGMLAVVQGMAGVGPDHTLTLSSVQAGIVNEYVQEFNGVFQQYSVAYPNGMEWGDFIDAFGNSPAGIQALAAALPPEILRAYVAERLETEEYVIINGVFIQPDHRIITRSNTETNPNDYPVMDMQAYLDLVYADSMGLAAPYVRGIVNSGEVGLLWEEMLGKDIDFIRNFDDQYQINNIYYTESSSISANTQSRTDNRMLAFLQDESIPQEERDRVIAELARTMQPGQFSFLLGANPELFALLSENEIFQRNMPLLVAPPDSEIAFYNESWAAIINNEQSPYNQTVRDADGRALNGLETQDNPLTIMVSGTEPAYAIQQINGQYYVVGRIENGQLVADAEMTVQPITLNQFPDGTEFTQYSIQVSDAIGAMAWNSVSVGRAGIQAILNGNVGSDNQFLITGMPDAFAVERTTVATLALEGESASLTLATPTLGVVFPEGVTRVATSTMDVPVNGIVTSSTSAYFTTASLAAVSQNFSAEFQGQVAAWSTQTLTEQMLEQSGNNPVACYLYAIQEYSNGVSVGSDGFRDIFNMELTNNFGSLNAEARARQVTSYNLMAIASIQDPEMRALAMEGFVTYTQGLSQGHVWEGTLDGAKDEILRVVRIMEPYVLSGDVEGLNAWSQGNLEPGQALTIMAMAAAAQEPLDITSLMVDSRYLPGASEEYVRAAATLEFIYGNPELKARMDAILLLPPEQRDAAMEGVQREARVAIYAHMGPNTPGYILDVINEDIAYFREHPAEYRVGSWPPANVPLEARVPVTYPAGTEGLTNEYVAVNPEYALAQYGIENFISANLTVGGTNFRSVADVLAFSDGSNGIGTYQSMVPFDMLADFAGTRGYHLSVVVEYAELWEQWSAIEGEDQASVDARAAIRDEIATLETTYSWLTTGVNGAPPFFDGTDADRADQSHAILTNYLPYAMEHDPQGQYRVAHENAVAWMGVPENRTEFNRVMEGATYDPAGLIPNAEGVYVPSPATATAQTITVVEGEYRYTMHVMIGTDGQATVQDVQIHNAQGEVTSLQFGGEPAYDLRTVQAGLVAGDPLEMWQSGVIPMPVAAGGATVSLPMGGHSDFVAGQAQAAGSGVFRFGVISADLGSFMAEAGVEISARSNLDTTVAGTVVAGGTSFIGGPVSWLGGAVIGYGAGTINNEDQTEFTDDQIYSITFDYEQAFAEPEKFSQFSRFLAELGTSRTISLLSPEQAEMCRNAATVIGSMEGMIHAEQAESIQRILASRTPPVFVETEDLTPHVIDQLLNPTDGVATRLGGEAITLTGEERFTVHEDMAPLRSAFSNVFGMLDASLSGGMVTTLSPQDVLLVATTGAQRLDETTIDAMIALLPQGTPEAELALEMLEVLKTRDTALYEGYYAALSPEFRGELSATGSIPADEAGLVAGYTAYLASMGITDVPANIGTMQGLREWAEFTVAQHPDRAVLLSLIPENPFDRLNQAAVDYAAGRITVEQFQAEVTAVTGDGALVDRMMEDAAPALREAYAMVVGGLEVAADIQHRIGELDFYVEPGQALPVNDEATREAYAAAIEGNTALSPEDKAWLLSLVNGEQALSLTALEELFTEGGAAYIPVEGLPVAPVLYRWSDADFQATVFDNSLAYMSVQAQTFEGNPQPLFVVESEYLRNVDETIHRVYYLDYGQRDAEGNPVRVQVPSDAIVWDENGNPVAVDRVALNGDTSVAAPVRVTQEFSDLTQFTVRQQGGGVDAGATVVEYRYEGQVYTVPDAALVWDESGTRIVGVDASRITASDSFPAEVIASIPPIPAPAVSGVERPLIGIARDLGDLPQFTVHQSAGGVDAGATVVEYRYNGQLYAIPEAALIWDESGTRIVGVDASRITASESFPAEVIASIPPTIAGVQQRLGAVYGNIVEAIASGQSFVTIGEDGMPHSTRADIPDADLQAFILFSVESFAEQPDFLRSTLGSLGLSTAQVEHVIRVTQTGVVSDRERETVAVIEGDISLQDVGLVVMDQVVSGEYINALYAHDPELALAFVAHQQLVNEWIALHPTASELPVELRVEWNVQPPAFIPASVDEIPEAAREGIEQRVWLIEAQSDARILGMYGELAREDILAALNLTQGVVTIGYDEEKDLPITTHVTVPETLTPLQWEALTTAAMLREHPEQLTAWLQGNPAMLTELAASLGITPPEMLLAQPEILTQVLTNVPANFNASILVPTYMLAGGEGAAIPAVVSATAVWNYMTAPESQVSIAEKEALLAQINLGLEPEDMTLEAFSVDQRQNTTARLVEANLDVATLLPDGGAALLGTTLYDARGLLLQSETSDQMLHSGYLAAEQTGTNEQANQIFQAGDAVDDIVRGTGAEQLNILVDFGRSIATGEPALTVESIDQAMDLVFELGTTEFDLPDFSTQPPGTMHVTGLAYVQETLRVTGRGNEAGVLGVFGRTITSLEGDEAQLAAFETSMTQLTQALLMNPDGTPRTTPLGAADLTSSYTDAEGNTFTPMSALQTVLPELIQNVQYGDAQMLWSTMGITSQDGLAAAFGVPVPVTDPEMQAMLDIIYHMDRLSPEAREQVAGMIENIQLPLDANDIPPLEDLWPVAQDYVQSYYGRAAGPDGVPPAVPQDLAGQQVAVAHIQAAVSEGMPENMRPLVSRIIGDALVEQPANGPLSTEMQAFIAEHGATITAPNFNIEEHPEILGDALTLAATWVASAPNTVTRQARAQQLQVDLAPVINERVPAAFRGLVNQIISDLPYMSETEIQQLATLDLSGGSIRAAVQAVDDLYIRQPARDLAALPDTASLAEINGRYAESIAELQARVAAFPLDPAPAVPPYTPPFATEQEYQAWREAMEAEVLRETERRINATRGAMLEFNSMIDFASSPFGSFIYALIGPLLEAFGLAPQGTMDAVNLYRGYDPATDAAQAIVDNPGQVAEVPAGLQVDSQGRSFIQTSNGVHVYYEPEGAWEHLSAEMQVALRNLAEVQAETMVSAVSAAIVTDTAARIAVNNALLSSNPEGALDHLLETGTITPEQHGKLVAAYGALQTEDSQAAMQLLVEPNGPLTQAEVSAMAPSGEWVSNDVSVLAGGTFGAEAAAEMAPQLALLPPVSTMDQHAIDAIAAQIGMPVTPGTSTSKEALLAYVVQHPELWNQAPFNVGELGEALNGLSALPHLSPAQIDAYVQAHPELHAVLGYVPAVPPETTGHFTENSPLSTANRGAFLASFTLPADDITYRAAAIQAEAIRDQADGQIHNGLNFMKAEMIEAIAPVPGENATPEEIAAYRQRLEAVAMAETVDELNALTNTGIAPASFAYGPIGDTAYTAVIDTAERTVTVLGPNGETRRYVLAEGMEASVILEEIAGDLGLQQGLLTGEVPVNAFGLAPVEETVVIPANAAGYDTALVLPQSRFQVLMTEDGRVIEQQGDAYFVIGQVGQDGVAVPVQPVVAYAEPVEALTGYTVTLMQGEDAPALDQSTALLASATAISRGDDAITVNGTATDMIVTWEVNTETLRRYIREVGENDAGESIYHIEGTGLQANDGIVVTLHDGPPREYTVSRGAQDFGTFAVPEGISDRELMESLAVLDLTDLPALEPRDITFGANGVLTEGATSPYSFHIEYAGVPLTATEQQQTEEMGLGLIARMAANADRAGNVAGSTDNLETFMARLRSGEPLNFGAPPDFNGPDAYLLGIGTEYDISAYVSADGRAFDMGDGVMLPLDTLSAEAYPANATPEERMEMDRALFQGVTGRLSLITDYTIHYDFAANQATITQNTPVDSRFADVPGLQAIIEDISVWGGALAMEEASFNNITVPTITAPSSVQQTRIAGM